MQRIARGLRLGFEYGSLSHTQTDSTKRIDLKRGSKVLQRGYSVVASVVSDDLKLKKNGRRVPKDERQAMVESYVMKYKEMNNGKFPTVSNTKKQVGGSYYVIKGILQEIEYRSKTSHALEKEATDVNRASLKPTFVDEVVKAPTTEAVKHKTTRDDDDADPGDSKFMRVDAEEEPKTSTSLKKTLAEELQGDSSSYIVNQKHRPEAESAEVIDLHSVKREHDMKESLPSKGPHPQMQRHKLSSESDELATGNSEKHTDDEEVPKRQSMWGNLKSLADGIMKIWRGS